LQRNAANARLDAVSRPGVTCVPGNTVIKEFYIHPYLFDKLGLFADAETEEERGAAARDYALGLLDTLNFSVRAWDGDNVIDDRAVLNALVRAAPQDYAGMTDEEMTSAVLSSSEEMVLPEDISVYVYSLDSDIIENEKISHTSYLLLAPGNDCRLAAVSFNGQSEYGGAAVRHGVHGKYLDFWFLGDLAKCTAPYYHGVGTPRPDVWEKEITIKGSNGHYKIFFEDLSFKGSYEVFNMAAQKVAGGELSHGASFELGAAGYYIIRVNVDGKGSVVRKVLRK
jgi:hypothetical protein